MTNLERPHAELRAALILAGRRIRKLNFGRRDDPVLTILRRTLRDARDAAGEPPNRNATYNEPRVLRR